MHATPQAPAIAALVSQPPSHTPLDRGAEGRSLIAGAPSWTGSPQEWGAAAGRCAIPAYLPRGIGGVGGGGSHSSYISAAPRSYLAATLGLGCVRRAARGAREPATGEHEPQDEADPLLRLHHRALPRAGGARQRGAP